MLPVHTQIDQYIPSWGTSDTSPLQFVDHTPSVALAADSDSTDARFIVSDGVVALTSCTTHAV